MQCPGDESVDTLNSALLFKKWSLQHLMWHFVSPLSHFSLYVQQHKGISKSFWELEGVDFNWSSSVKKQYSFLFYQLWGWNSKAGLELGRWFWTCLVTAWDQLFLGLHLMEKKDLFLEGQSLHHPGAGRARTISWLLFFPSRSTPTTWKPTPGRRSPQNPTRKSVSLEFPFFPCNPEVLEGAVFLFTVWLYAGFEMLLVLQHWGLTHLRQFGSLASLSPCLGKVTVPGSAPRGSSSSLLPLRPWNLTSCFSPSKIPAFFFLP